MSTYYQISGLKIRVSDHEPNERLNGYSDIELYTVDVCGQKLSVAGQLEHICERRQLDINIFAAVLSDFQDPEYIDTDIQKIIVSDEFIKAYHSIPGRGSAKRRRAYSEKFGYDDYYISQGRYRTEKNTNK